MVARGVLQLAPGTLFASDFRIVKPLSEGGMGAVYVAEQLSTGKQRALKLMLPNLVADAKLRQRFEQEARVGSRIESEHVIEVVGAGVDASSGAPWLAMELLQGENLGDLVGRTGALPLNDVRSILEQLCHAIGAAHDAGIVHRDLKPENVFLAKSRRAGVQSTVKVLDFGIAKIAAEAKTTVTAAIGSPMWMAPEQTARGGVIAPQTDVWAIGLIAFHLLTARFFWRSAEEEGGTLANLIREIVLDPMPTASARAAEVGGAARLPPGFDAWFARAVERDPRVRFANAREAHAAFESGGAGTPIRASFSSSPAQAALAATANDPAALGTGTGPLPGRSSTTVGVADEVLARSGPRRSKNARAIGWASLALSTVFALVAAVVMARPSRLVDAPVDSRSTSAPSAAPLAPAALPSTVSPPPVAEAPAVATDAGSTPPPTRPVQASHPVIATGASGCLSNADCKAGRICQRGACVNAAASASGCSSNADCKGGRQCVDGSCRGP